MAKQQISKKCKALWADSRSYRTRLGLSAAVVGALCFMYQFFGPLELTAFSPSLVFGWRDVVLPLLVLFLGTVAVAAPLAALLRGKLFNYALSLLVTFLVAGYLQGALLNGGLGLLTGDGIDWSAHRGQMLWSLLLWAAVLGLSLLGQYLSRKLWTRGVLLACALLTVMQLAPTAGILLGAYDQPGQQTDVYLSDGGFYELSAKDNVILIVLDRLDYDYIRRLQQKDPTFLQQLDGFTCYDNAISAYARTRPALAHMLTGSESAFSVSAQTYYRNAWKEGGRDLLGDLKKGGYTSELYATMRNLFSDAAYAEERVANLSNGRDGLDWGTALKKLTQLSAFRYFPTALKPFYWADTNYYNEGIYRESAHSAYQFDDAAYCAGFPEATAERKGGSFKLYHFYGTHSPYNLNADGSASETQTTLDDQTVGSFRNLLKLFDRMKELGIYEDATIIITGDHGSAISDYKPLQKATLVGLFYKPSGSAGTPLQRSDAPVSTGDIPATLLKAAGCDYSAYGKALDDIGEDEQRVRRYYKTAIDEKTYAEVYLYTYEVVGHASDFNNWTVVAEGPIDHNYN